MKISRNSVVTLYHQLGTSDGTVLEDTFEDEPMTFRLGTGELAEGLELAILGLEEGDEQTLDIAPDLAFGYPDENRVQTLSRDEFDPSLELQEGLIIEFCTPSGETLPGTIVKFDDRDVSVDFNHPLAGMSVRYRVKIVDIEDSGETPDLIN